NKLSYGMLWSNALRGLYVLRAVATDTRGGIGASEPVRISITGTNPPSTNPPIVTIFATDPIAAEGTNFWTWRTNSHGTNWLGRTNTATFEIRRSGATNSNLTVAFEIGG